MLKEEDQRGYKTDKQHFSPWEETNPLVNVEETPTPIQEMRKEVS